MLTLHGLPKVPEPYGSGKRSFDAVPRNVTAHWRLINHCWGANDGTRVMGNTTLMESTLLAMILLGVTTMIAGLLMLAV